MGKGMVVRRQGKKPGVVGGLEMIRIPPSPPRNIKMASPAGGHFFISRTETVGFEDPPVLGRGSPNRPSSAASRQGASGATSPPPEAARSALTTHPRAPRAPSAATRRAVRRPTEVSLGISPPPPERNNGLPAGVRSSPLNSAFPTSPNKTTPPSTPEFQKAHPGSMPCCATSPHTTPPCSPG